MAANRGDKKAKKAQGKAKSNRQTRAPKQRGKIKNAQKPDRGSWVEMRDRPPVSNLDRASNKIEATGVDSAVARNVAHWRIRQHLA